MKVVSIVAVLVIVGGSFTDEALADIQVENKTARSITIWLQGEKDSRFSLAYNIRAGRVTRLPIQPGRYYVAARMRGGELAYLGWHHYSNHKIVYQLRSDVCCAARSPSIVKTPPQTRDHLFGSVHEAEGGYYCRHGRWHTQWKPDFEQ